jgi:membrane protein implicated in regulation of membrane protease activity
MAWWLWLVLGFVLCGLELAGPGGFFLIFFGVGALAVGVLSVLGLVETAWLQWLLFSLLSIVSLLLFREPLLRLMRRFDRGPGEIDTLANELALPLDTIPPGAVGRAELRGTIWNARNVDTEALSPGQRCAVARVDGLMIFIRREGVV